METAASSVLQLYAVAYVGSGGGGKIICVCKGKERWTVGRSGRLISPAEQRGEEGKTIKPKKFFSLPPSPPVSPGRHTKQQQRRGPTTLTYENVTPPPSLPRYTYTHTGGGKGESVQNQVCSCPPSFHCCWYTYTGVDDEDEFLEEESRSLFGSSSSSSFRNARLQPPNRKGEGRGEIRRWCRVLCLYRHLINNSFLFFFAQGPYTKQ